MAKEVKVKKLIIELDGKDVELTMAQAKELLSALSELFEEKVRVVKEREYVPRPYPVPEPYPYPVYPRPWHPWRREPWITWTNDVPLYKSTSGTTFELKSGAIRCQLKS